MLGRGSLLGSATQCIRHNALRHSPEICNHVPLHKGAVPQARSSQRYLSLVHIPVLPAQVFLTPTHLAIVMEYAAGKGHHTGKQQRA